MNKHNLLHLLENYHPASKNEQSFKNRMIDFIIQHDNCFERTLETGHVTASAWLLNKDHTQALLMHHAKLGQWYQLGGHSDGNPDTLTVAINEAQEESGIKNISPVISTIFDIDIHLIPANKKEKEHYHYDVRFLLHVTSDEQVIQNNESNELRWIGKNCDELPTTSESVVRMFKKWIAL